MRWRCEGGEGVEAVRLDDEFWCVREGLRERCSEDVELVRLEDEFCCVREVLRMEGELCSGGVEVNDEENTSFCESERWLPPSSGERWSLSNDMRLACREKLLSVGRLETEGGPFMDAAFRLPLFADHSSRDTPPPVPRSIDELFA